MTIKKNTRNLIAIFITVWMRGDTKRGTLQDGGAHPGIHSKPLVLDDVIGQLHASYRSGGRQASNYGGTN